MNKAYPKGHVVTDIRFSRKCGTIELVETRHFFFALGGITEYRGRILPNMSIPPLL